MSKLLIIPESQIRKGGYLGSGAFGKVYIGLWLPDDKVNRLPVAIKILHENPKPSNSNSNSNGHSNSDNEFIDEGYRMASLDHPNLLQLFAISLGTEMMLITYLMPLGCLLDFVKCNQDTIGNILR